ncbi:tautomerase family protein [Turicimonas muris]
MPIVTIKITGDEESPSAESKKQLISKITNVIGEVLHKNTRNLCVIIEEVPMDNYGIGGVTVRELRRRK